MYIHYVKLRGFRSVQDSFTFEFTKGVNMLFGKNGSGKSTVMKAVKLLLTGQIDEKNLDELINENEEDFSLEFRYDHLGHEYLDKMFHSRKKGKDTRELYVDDFDSPSFNTLSTVKEAVAKILEPNLANHALAMMQDSKAILELGDAPRLELFKKIKNITFSKEVVDLETKIKTLKNEDLHKLELEITSLKAKTYSLIETKEETLSKEELIKVKEEINTLNSSILNLESVKDKYLALKSNITKLDSDITINKNELETLEAKVKLKEEELINYNKTRELEHEQLVLSKTTKENELNGLSLDTSSVTKRYEQDKETLVNDINVLTNKLESIVIERVRTRDYESMISDNDKKLLEINTKINTLTTEIARMQSGNCPTCNRPFPVTDLQLKQDEVANLTTQKTELEEATKELKANKNTQDKSLQNIEIKKIEKSSLEKEINSKEQELSKLHETYNKNLESEKTLFESKKSNLENQISAMNKELDSFDTSTNSVVASKLEVIKSNEESISKVSNTMESLTTQKEEVQAEIDSNYSNINFEELDSLVLVKKEKETLVENYDAIIQHNKTAKEHNEKIELEQKSDLSKIEDLKKSKIEVENQIAYNDEARKKFLKDFPNYIIQETIKDIEDSSNNFISSVGYKDLNLSFKSTASSLKFLCGSNEKRKRSTNTLSGAESILACLSFVHTLNTELELDMIMLDEVDQTLDEDNTKALFEIISNIDYGQVILITHNKYMQNKFIEEGINSYEFSNKDIRKVN